MVWVVGPVGPAHAQQRRRLIGDRHLRFACKTLKRQPRPAKERAFWEELAAAESSPVNRPGPPP